MITDEQARILGERWFNAGGGLRAGMVLAALHDWSIRFRIASPEGVTIPAGPDVAGAKVAGPDLRDAATKGAALEVVRERLGLPFLFIHHSSVGWLVERGDGDFVRHADRSRIQTDTEEEALVAALESANA